MCGKVVLLIM